MRFNWRIAVAPRCNLDCISALVSLKATSHARRNVRGRFVSAPTGMHPVEHFH